MAINDIYADGIASGWKVRDASAFTARQVLEADVAIVGSGAGGGTAAEILSQSGLKVLILEEGPLKTSAGFKDMQELRAYRELYQEAGGRATSDGAIAILQGRAVGGTTVVNFTSSFRTPPETLRHWAQVHGVEGASVEDMAPWFAKMEQRLGVAPWAVQPNENNLALKTACEKLGWDWHVIPRNVRGCWNSGYCGLGCPVNAKQSMLVTTIPAALRKGAELVHHLQVQCVQFERNRVTGLICRALDPDCIAPSGVEVEVRARHYVLAGGAINTPALLLRSAAPDPHRRLGKRTTIHPIVALLGQMPQVVNSFYGAPQSIGSDEFLWKNLRPDSPGFKIEVAPLLPAQAASFVRIHGAVLAEDMAKLPYMTAIGVILRDGFHEASPGGEVRVADDGSPLLDYDFSDYLWRGVRRAMLCLAEAHFAAGAVRVLPSHLDAGWYNSLDQARSGINQLQMRKFRVNLFTAHLMGGCAMGEDARQAVVRSDGRHHQLENLSVIDGSVFPTSIGANPQLSIYGMSCKNATVLAGQLGGTPAA
jgi:choline dehydrogenase-like flavoprotein